VLCTLPFEEEWYRRRKVPVRYVGHPYFDELSRQRLDGVFVAEQRRRPGPVVALLPGSRRSEIANNAPSLLRAAALIHARRPDVRFLVACLNEAHQARVTALLPAGPLPIEVHAGRTPEIIHLAHSCLAVSGSVGLELLHHGKPSVVLYRENGLLIKISRRFFMKCRYISLVNLLAERELFPEYLTGDCPAEALAGHVLGWLHDRPAYEALCGELSALRRRVAQPGACERAARCVLELIESRTRRRAG
jgi:lipid-A-disaccharide synthase